MSDEITPKEFRTDTGKYRAYKGVRLHTNLQWVGMVILAASFWGALVEMGACKKTGGFPWTTKPEVVEIVDDAVVPVVKDVSDLKAEVKTMTSTLPEEAAKRVVEAMRPLLGGRNGHR